MCRGIHLARSNGGHQNSDVVSLAITTKIMKENTNKSQERVFSDTYQMETQTLYHEDGTILTTPLAYELGKLITCSGGTVKFKANVVVDSDGNTSVTRMKSTGTKRYRTLYETKHGVILETKKHVVVKLQFPKDRGRLEICDMLEDEVEDLGIFLETTNKIQQWQ